MQSTIRRFEQGRLATRSAAIAAFVRRLAGCSRRIPVRVSEAIADAPAILRLEEWRANFRVAILHLWNVCDGQRTPEACCSLGIRLQCFWTWLAGVQPVPFPSAVR